MLNSMSSPSTYAWRDWVGVTASIGCAIHCAAMPFVIAYLPAMGLSFLADEAFHKWMAFICFLIAMGAFVPGFRMHGNWVPLSVGGVGIGIITFAAFGLAGQCCPSCDVESSAADPKGITATCDECEQCVQCELSQTDGGGSAAVESIGQDAQEQTLLAKFAPWLTPLGGFLLVTAHLLNRRYGFRCRCC